MYLLSDSARLINGQIIRVDGGMKGLVSQDALAIGGTRNARTILQMSFNCGQPSHIGGALSIVDILAVCMDAFQILI